MRTAGYIDQLHQGIACLGCDIRTGTPIPIAEGTTTTIDFELSMAGRISGRVTDAASGAGLGDVTITVRDSNGQFVADTSTNADGSYVTLSGLPPGTYFVQTEWAPSAHVNGLYDGHTCAGCDVRTGTPITVFAGMTTPDIDFALGIGGRIVGRVTDAATGAGVPDVPVGIFTTDHALVTAGFTDQDGRYAVISGLPTGTYYAATFNQSGYVDQVHQGIPCTASCESVAGTPIPVIVGEDTTVDFALARPAAAVQDALNARHEPDRLPPMWPLSALGVVFVGVVLSSRSRARLRSASGRASWRR